MSAPISLDIPHKLGKAAVRERPTVESARSAG